MYTNTTIYILRYTDCPNTSIGEKQVKMSKKINIMTTCDNNIATYILPQLVSIDVNLHEYDVNFFLVHCRISNENIEILREFCENTCIRFNEIVVTDNTEFYESLVISGGRQWPREAYFTLRVQDYLPDDIDRILYIDAGDVIIDGDIRPYYFDSFEGNSIIATPLGFKTDPATNKTSLYSSDDILSVRNGSLFNSGSYIINVEKFRNEGYSIDDFLYLDDILKQNTETGNAPYFGDQGFLAAAFVGDVKFYGYPEYKDPSYMPFNFRSSYWGLFKNELTYKPVIIHYAIISKPWIVRFNDETIDKFISHPNFVSNHLVTPIPPLAYMTPEHLRLCELWWKYAEKTPIYRDADIQARITADSWLKYYFPICAQYISLFYQHESLKRQLVKN